MDSGPVGRRAALMQADEVLYLHPGRSQPYGSAIEVGTDPLPEVVLEVDHELRKGGSRNWFRWLMGLWSRGQQTNVNGELRI